MNRFNKRLISIIERHKKQRIINFQTRKLCDKNRKRRAIVDWNHIQRGGSIV